MEYWNKVSIKLNNPDLFEKWQRVKKKVWLFEKAKKQKNKKKPSFQVN